MTALEKRKKELRDFVNYKFDPRDETKISNLAQDLLTAIEALEKYAAREKLFPEYAPIAREALSTIAGGSLR